MNLNKLYLKNRYMIDSLKIKIVTLFPNKYNFSNKLQKHKLEDILTILLYILETGVPYSKVITCISKSTLNRHMLFLSKNNILKSCYVELLEKYMMTKKADKLKYQLIDSSFIPNQYASNECITRNKYYKNKKGYKISNITDKNGIPISVIIGKGSSNDSIFIEEHFQNMLITTNTDEYKNSHRYMQYILADKGYDTLNFRKICTDKGYIDVIDHNKRNTKDKTKLKKFSQKEKCIYKKRITIENSFSWIKKNRRLCNVYDKKISVYISFLYMAFIKILLKRTNL